jgi:signal peptidase I
MTEFLKSLFREFLLFVLLALVIILPFRLFIAQPFVVEGRSMEPTFENGEYLVVDQLTYRLEEPERGDVITFRYPKNPSLFFIKRIVGLPGEHVEVANGTVTISKDGETAFSLEEPYARDDLPGLPPFEKDLKEGEYYVLGDNRPESSDSRVWGILPKENIMGRVLFRLFPPQKFDVFPGEYHAYGS